MGCRETGESLVLSAMGCRETEESLVLFTMGCRETEESLVLSAMGSAYGPVQRRGQAFCHPEPLFQVVSEEGPKNRQTPATLIINCSLLPHSKRYRSAKSRSKRLLNSFYLPPHLPGAAGSLVVRALGQEPKGC
jgi:hypothetical protein